MPDLLDGPGPIDRTEIYAPGHDCGSRWKRPGCRAPPVLPGPATLSVDITHVAPVADKLFAGLSPERSRLLIARTGETLVGWVHIHRNPSPLIAHWGTISHLQSLPSARSQGIGSALMAHARQVARSQMGLEQLRLAVRGGTGLERFYTRLGWTVTGHWPGALRLAPGDDRDEILMILTPL